MPVVSTDYGFFAEASSPAAGASEIHRVHLEASWPAAFTGPATVANGGATRKCASCHAAAACDACHASPAPTHAAHGAPDAVPTRLAASGTPVGDEGVLTATERESSCTAAQCHPVTRFESGPVLIEDTSDEVVYGGAWASSTSSRFSAGSAAFATAAGAKASISVGEGIVTWVGTKAPSGGIAEVLVDGQVVATIDTYSASTTDRQELYSADLGAGGTLTVRATGTKRAAATKATVCSMLSARNPPVG